MNLSNDAYQISIEKMSDKPLQFIDAQRYDRVFDPHGYMNREFRTAFIITIQTGQNKTHIALIGSFFANPDQCAVLDDENLTVLMDDIIVRFDLHLMDIISHGIVGDYTYFSIYPIKEGYIIHGELEILRLDRKFQRVWDFWGSDIWVRPYGGGAFTISNDQIVLEDWNGVRYALGMDGKLIWNTYKR